VQTGYTTPCMAYQFNQIITTHCTKMSTGFLTVSTIGMIKMLDNYTLHVH